MKVWITKYALTSGIFVIEDAEKTENGVLWQTTGRMIESYHGKDWHETWESARDRAEEMQVKKIKSLKKQMYKILAMKFHNPDK